MNATSMSDDARSASAAFFARLQALAKRDPRLAVLVATQKTYLSFL